MKTTLLIDGDEYLFKACAAVEREVRWDEWNHVLTANREDAWANFNRMIGQLFERFDTIEHTLCFSTQHKPNFRLAIDPMYKGGRSTRKPLCYADLRKMCDTEYLVVAVESLEADDVMGILATKPGKRARDHIIVSQDKDMKTIPGKLFREGEVMTITAEEADYNHLYQTLTGDITDGFKGLPGCGPKKAEAILTQSAPIPGTAWEPWGKVVAAYTKAGLTEADALKQARLARILRWEDWDTEKKEPILWTPK